MSVVSWKQVFSALLLVCMMREGGGHRDELSQWLHQQDLYDDASIIDPTASSPSSEELDDDDESSTASSTLTEDRLFRMRQRSRRHRLESIRYEILRRLGMQRPPSVNITPETRHKALEVMDNFPALSETQPATERTCYSAACDIPHLVNGTLWEDSGSLGLRLYIPVSRDRGSDSDLQSASLRLFLKPNPAACNCPCLDEGALEGQHCMSGLLVSVYQFIRPLSIRRRNKIVNKRRLLDAKFVPAVGNAWVSLNIENVVREWKRNRRNFGLEVTVKDDNDTEIDARRLFIPPDCNVGREIGCPEDIGESLRLMPPWFVNHRDNFPYVDTVSVRQTRSRRARRHRARRSAAQRPLLVDFVQEGGEHATPTQKSSPPAHSRLSCRGTDAVIKVTDENVVHPKSFVSKMCPSTCWDCENVQCVPRPCSAPTTEPVRGLYRLDNGETATMTLPVTKIVQCGC